MFKNAQSLLNCEKNHVDGSCIARTLGTFSCVQAIRYVDPYHCAHNIARTLGTFAMFTECCEPLLFMYAGRHVDPIIAPITSLER